MPDANSRRDRHFNEPFPMSDRDSREAKSAAYRGDGAIGRAIQLIGSGYSISEIAAIYPEAKSEDLAVALHFATRGASAGSGMNGVRFRCDALANAWGAWTEIGAHSVARTYRIVATAEKGAAKIEGIVRYGGQRQAAAASFADSIAIRTGRFAGKLEVCFRSLTIATTVIGTVTMADE